MMPTLTMKAVKGEDGDSLEPINKNTSSLENDITARHVLVRAIAAVPVFFPRVDSNSEPGRSSEQIVSAELLAPEFGLEKLTVLFVNSKDAYAEARLQLVTMPAVRML
ncbi:hypothetical protein RRG08_016962 [Elysia crispata]|uniref:Uncharacterized protein n=1 Tax=Elysia crispata TaxID=231223 RepID=A0AAE0XZ11_9GAST|nr:hypothetical protein RRG08_016962 [Elysia crispata]